MGKMIIGVIGFLMLILVVVGSGKAASIDVGGLWYSSVGCH
jgi:DMSO/TMAO reductase YedYZ heme-binding membrane subunit